MTVPVSSLAPADAQALVDALLFSVSHDLRSPLLTMSLSADLIEDALLKQGVPVEGGPTGVALEALRHGAQDLERMLQALTQVSRARRRPLEPARAPLRVVLGGYRVAALEAGLEQRTICIDPLTVREILDAATDEHSSEVHARREGDSVVLEVAMTLEPPAASPLGTLAASLQHGAGALVERLAVAQVLVERQGGAVRTQDGRLAVWLPLEAEA